jgi:hypothetical protein
MLPLRCAQKCNKLQWLRRDAAQVLYLDVQMDRHTLLGNSLFAHLVGGNRPNRNSDTDDGSDVDRAEIAAVKAIAGATQNEDLLRAQSSTTAPSRQWSIKCISATCDQKCVAGSPHSRTQPTDSVASDCRNRLDQQRLGSEVLPNSCEPPKALWKGDEHEVAALRRSLDDAVETYRDARSHVPDNQRRGRDDGRESKE